MCPRATICVLILLIWPAERTMMMRMTENRGPWVLLRRSSTNARMHSSTTSTFLQLLLLHLRRTRHLASSIFIITLWVYQKDDCEAGYERSKPHLLAALTWARTATSPALSKPEQTWSAPSVYRSTVNVMIEMHIILQRREQWYHSSMRCDVGWLKFSICTRIRLKDELGWQPLVLWHALV
jgi:hypothetical protein